MQHKPLGCKRRDRKHTDNPPDGFRYSFRTRARDRPFVRPFHRQQHVSSLGTSWICKRLQLCQGKLHLIHLCLDMSEGKVGGMKYGRLNDLFRNGKWDLLVLCSNRAARRVTSLWELVEFDLCFSLDEPVKVFCRYWNLLY